MIPMVLKVMDCSLCWRFSACYPVPVNPSPRRQRHGPAQTAGGRIPDLAGDPDIRTLIHVLSFNEGRKPARYDDHKGIATIGVGFNLERGDARAKIEALGLDYDAVLAGDKELSQAQIDELLESTMAQAIEDARGVIPGFNDLTTPRQIVLADMAFNLGRAGLSKFRKMIAAIAVEDWDEAAEQMIDSKWYREVGHRGPRNVSVMRTGELVSDYIPPEAGGTAFV
jgi:lysozyme